jgi:hypothetical protein
MNWSGVLSVEAEAIALFRSHNTLCCGFFFGIVWYGKISYYVFIMKDYDHKKIEPKWQKYWDKRSCIKPRRIQKNRSFLA